MRATRRPSCCRTGWTSRSGWSGLGALAHRWPKVNHLHVITEASVDALNARLDAAGEPQVTAQRFRFNVLLSGAERPFVEEELEVIEFGTASLVLTKPSKRCRLVNIDPRDAGHQPAPLRTIAAMSVERAQASRLSFGVYSRIRGPELAVGMSARADA